MQKFCWYILFIGVIATSCRQQLATETPPKNSAERNVEELIAQLEDATSDQVLVVAHRGDWRHAPENSLQAIQNCIDMGLDMVEIDVRMTKDSQLVIMHDETLNRTTTGKGKVSDWTLDSLRTLRLRNGLGRATYHTIPTLEEAMLVCKDKILVNLDKCYDYFDKAYKILEKTGTIDHVVMKGKVPVAQVQAEFGEYLDKVYFMPIVDLNAPNAASIIKDYQATLQPVAFEFIFSDESSDVLNQFEAIKQRGARVWINSLWASLNAGYEDEKAVQDPEGNYGWIIGKGANIIQTDRPAMLLEFLRKKSLHH